MAYQERGVFMDHLIDGKFAVTCVRLSAIVALFTAVASGISLFVYMGNEHLTKNFLAFALCMLLICPVCAIGGFCALHKNSARSALLFVVASIFAFAALIGVMIAFLVEPDDQDSLAGLFPGNVFMIVWEYIIVLLVVLLSIYCGQRVAKLIQTGRLRSILKGEDATTPPPMAQTGDFGPSPPGDSDTISIETGSHASVALEDNF